MSNQSFKQIDLLRNRRAETLLLDPYFIDNKKFIKKGIYLGSSLIFTVLSIGLGFIVRTNIIEQKKFNIKDFSDQYDAMVIKLDNESNELKKVADFNKKLRESISNISSSSALLKEISLLVPEGMQLINMNQIGDKLTLRSKINHEKPIELVNAFLIRLEDSEFIDFDLIDLTNFNFIKEESEDKKYEVDIESNISNEFAKINKKYLKELGSLGLLNRINNLNKIFESK